MVRGGVDPLLVTVFHDPQTSGGLLAAVGPEHAPAARAAFAAAGVDARAIGRVESGPPAVVLE